MGRLEKIKEIVQKRMNNKELIQNQLKHLKKRKRKEKKELLNKEKALIFVKRIALKTQNQLEFHLSDMVTTGLNSVFEEEYGFRILFEEKKKGGRTECRLFFEKKGNLVDPLNFSGLGESDIAAFCLHGAAWSMDKRYRNILILDEPFKHLKGEDENIRAIQMMQMMSRELKIQIICINDERAPREKIIEFADKVFEVKQNKKGISNIKILKENHHGENYV